ncbi:hypothetical protein SEPCBS57363_006467 [Sporothrix epigloea]|uniref:Domain of unknown function at the cortex 1 domain-containing protein n=1 Tax=Sporothrix epigloea TaxID=1892477 RepID=A0ABP0E6H3_9PEZI
MHSPDEFRIRVTAGTDYDPATHVRVHVNDAEPLRLSGPGGDVWLNVRIKNYRSERDDDAQSSSPYFDTEPHKKNDDTYGISLWFVPKRESKQHGEGEEDKEDQEGIVGSDLQWGNDFDEPLRDRLPPGFGAALRIVKWWIDPGLEGDPYADRPYLYGPALSSFNRVYAALGDESESNERSEEKKKLPLRDGCGLWFGEGGDAGGRAWRESIGCPDEDTDTTTGHGHGGGKARMAWALGAAAKAQWTWQYGKGYGLDFYNGYLDFADLTLRLPGFHLALLRYYASEKAEKTCLRYVLRHRQTGRVYAVVVFSLVRVNKAGETVDEDEGIAEVEDNGDNDDEVDEDKIIEQARQTLSIHDEVHVEASDVD